MASGRPLPSRSPAFSLRRFPLERDRACPVERSASKLTDPVPPPTNPPTVGIADRGLH